MTVIDDLTDAATRVTAAATSVVRIGRGPGRGTGVVTADGVVVTNAHNLRGREATVTFSNGRVATATVAGIDPDGDLAALRVDTTGAVALAVAPAGGLVAGTPVWALAALPGGGARVSFGVVSATGREFRSPGGRRIADAVEHTAPLAPGSSGGPVLDSEGRALAVNTHRLDGGFYLARPLTDELVARLAGLADGNDVRRPHLGVAITPPGAARRLREAAGLEAHDGVLVAAVEDDSPAGRAGLRRGDLLVAATADRAGQEPVRTVLTGSDDLFEVLGRSGDRLTLTVLRPDGQVDVEVTLAAPTSGD